MRVALLTLLCLPALTPPAEEKSDRAAQPDLSYEEKLLKDAGVTPDGPGLVAFFRSRTLSAEDQKRLAAAIPLLGDESYTTREKATRELIAAGRFAVPYIKPALKSDDPETVRRAERCLSAIDQAPYASLMTAAAHVASHRRPEGASEAMLACLPWVEDEAVEEALFDALLKTAQKENAADAALTAAATDREPARRAAAAFVLGQAWPRHAKQSRQLLTDPSTKVRFHAAASLLQSGDREAMPTLLALLTDGPVALAWRAEDVLGRLAGDLDPPVPPAGAEAEGRRRARAAWEAWWKEKGDHVDLARLRQEDPVLGLNLITELDRSGQANSGRVWECGADGKPRWEITNVQRPIDARVLSGGRVLIAEHGVQRVTERDREGKVLWEHKTTAMPVCCQRLGNGNTVIGTYNELLEVTREGKVVFTHKVTGAQAYYAQKLRNGHYVAVLSNNRVIELDESGKEIHSLTIPNSSGWASVERLPNTNFLVALYSANKVVEVDSAGKVVWELPVRNPGHATRLRNGNTLVASVGGQFVAEFGRDGKEIWKQQTPGRPFHVYRR
jgi:HEAT repeat protein